MEGGSNLKKLEKVEPMVSWEQHKSQEELERFFKAELTEQEQETILEHLSYCDFCALQYSEFMETHLIKAPFDMKANILENSNFNKNTSKFMRRNFYQYCAKVCIGMFTSLLLIFGNVGIYQKLSFVQSQSAKYSTTILNSATEQMKQWNNFFMITEGSYDDTQKR